MGLEHGIDLWMLKARTQRPLGSNRERPPKIQKPYRWLGLLGELLEGLGKVLVPFYGIAGMVTGGMVSGQLLGVVLYGIGGLAVGLMVMVIGCGLADLFRAIRDASIALQSLRHRPPQRGGTTAGGESSPSPSPGNLPPPGNPPPSRGGV